MHGTVPQKIGRVITNLVTHPQYISRCVAHNLLKNTTPLDLGIPWFSYAAVDFLEEWLGPQMTVCEYGSGGSTIFFAQRVRRVLSIEDNPQWHELVASRIRDHGLTNAQVVLHPFDFKNPVAFEKSEYFNAIPAEKFDVIVVDGSEEWTQVRPICFQNAEKHVRSGGAIVVDDSWRYPQLRVQNSAKSVRIFQSVGPCRPGVTSTDIFFY